MLFEDIALVLPFVRDEERHEPSILWYNQFRTTWCFEVAVIEVYEKVPLEYQISCPAPDLLDSPFGLAWTLTVFQKRRMLNSASIDYKHHETLGAGDARTVCLTHRWCTFDLGFRRPAGGSVRPHAQCTTSGRGRYVRLLSLNMTR